MKDSTGIVLAQIEARLRQEAKAFINRAMHLESAEEIHETQVKKVVGFGISCSADLQKARKQLLARLADEKRRAKRCSPGYDLNRHISLSRALEALCAIERRSFERPKCKLPPAN